jgi:hypothetical protein
VDVFIRYPANSVVDIKAVTSKLVANGTIVPSGGVGGVGGKADKTQVVSTKRYISRS